MINSHYINDVPIQCINKAAIQYRVSAYIIASIITVENGKVGMASLNKNGTYDYGPMQINTVWLDKLNSYGITRDQIQNNPCTNVWVGAWILSQKLAENNSYWEAVGAYHSYSQPLNYYYQQKVAATYSKIVAFFSRKKRN